MWEFRENVKIFRITRARAKVSVDFQIKGWKSLTISLVRGNLILFS